MAKSEYEINERIFHVEKTESGWIGWFIDDPVAVFSDQLKMGVLCQAGYRIQSSGGLVVTIGASKRKYAPPRTMQDAYEDFRKRLASGYSPTFNRDKPLSKFVILARDRCKCIYCDRVAELS